MRGASAEGNRRPTRTVYLFLGSHRQHAFEAVRGVTTLTSRSRPALGFSPEALVDFDFLCPSLSLSARLLVAISSHSPRRQQFLQRVDNEWDHRHVVLMHAGTYVVPPAPRPSPCVLAGFCVCNLGGKNITQIRSSWQKSCLAPANPEGASGMPLLLEGYLVVRLDAFAKGAGEDAAPPPPRVPLVAHRLAQQVA